MAITVHAHYVKYDIKRRDYSVLGYGVSCYRLWCDRPLAYGQPSYLHAVADPEGGRGGMAPRWRPEKIFWQYINIITKPTAYDGPWEY